MSAPVDSLKSNFTSLDPNKELSSHSCKNKLWRITAIITAVAYTALAVVALILAASYIPVYVPIVVVAAIILADVVINTAMRYFDGKAGAHKRLAKMNQGIVDQLNQIPQETENRFLRARAAYMGEYLTKCDEKIAFHAKAAGAEEDLRPPALHLDKAGEWTQKKLVVKLCAAYCDALLEEPSKAGDPFVVSQSSFYMRVLEQEFSPKGEVLARLNNGTQLSSKQVEKLSVEELKGVILGHEPAV